MKLRRILIGSLLGIMVVAGRAAGENGGNQAKAIAQAWVEAWNSHDPDKMVTAFTSDVYYEDVAFGEISRGTAELKKFAASEYEAVPDLKVELQNAQISNGRGTIEWVFSGTDKDIYKTGKKFSVRGVSVIEVRDGKIARSLDYYDAATIMKQTGVVPK
jgi:steroid delta-isomerase-like uncharacterized protein